ncbi:uncharacterized protein LOC129743451 [Uranotaenia lowii]|uniref:uncharacterized protein LOC129743451 n=1 Tax=Uranotaenia lowii TaxID=190385 RepID=UPI00247A8347|nr:uncharacterized protein LOC129743451 [Uranotaenia lowii]
MSPSPGDHPGRTIPEWMDTENLQGRLYYMFLRAKPGHTLPKNPFVIGRSVEEYAGKVEGGFYEKRKSWYVVKIRSKDQGRKLFTLTALKDGTPIEIGRHPELNTRKFVVFCNEVEDMTDKQLEEELASQKITNVRRITKKIAGKIVNTPTLVLTINCTVIPEFINFGLLRVRTRPYYPQPMLCRRCLTYGHPKIRCQNEIACNICSSNHESQNCTSKVKFCQNCKQNHSPTDRACPIWMFESAALKLKTEQKITLTAARKQIERNSTNSSYADVVKRQIQAHNNIARKTQPVKKAPQPEDPEKKEDQQQQQQPTKPISIRDHLTAEPKTSVPVLESDSPPRKRTTSQPTPPVTVENVEDKNLHTVDDNCTILTRARAARMQTYPHSSTLPKS